MEFIKHVGNLKLYTRKNKEEIATFFAHDISRKLKEYRDIERKDVLFLSSGGSSLLALDRIDPEVIGPYLTIGIFDERYDPSNKTSNYAQLRKTEFYKRAVRHGCRLIDTTTKPDTSMEELAEFYEQELRHWRHTHPRGAIMATMGIAANGHTAGIMPFPEDPSYFKKLFEGERWIVAYDVGDKDQFQLRVTTTFTFLRMVDIVGIFITGENKSEMFRALMSGDDCAELPGRIIKTLPRGAVYTDEHLVRSAGFAAPK